jgi:RNA polymerase sigma-70 factor (ECF subfamily)
VVSLDAEATNDKEPAFQWELQAVGAEYNPAEFVLKKERSEFLHEAIQQLPEQMRRCMHLRVKKDLAPQEIADLLRLSVNTVKAHLQQAQKALRQKLGTTLREV